MIHIMVKKVKKVEKTEKVKILTAIVMAVKEKKIQMSRGIVMNKEMEKVIIVNQAVDQEAQTIVIVQIVKLKREKKIVSKMLLQMKTIMLVMEK